MPHGFHHQAHMDALQDTQGMTVGWLSARVDSGGSY